MNPDYECSDRRKSVLGGDDLKVIQEAVRNAINIEISQAVKTLLEVEREKTLEIIRKDRSTHCPFSITQVRDVVPHALGVVRDLGNGDENLGLRKVRKILNWGNDWSECNEELRKAVTWSGKMRRNIDKWWFLIVTGLITIVISSVGNIFLTGLRHMSGNL